MLQSAEKRKVKRIDIDSRPVEKEKVAGCFKGQDLSFGAAKERKL
jgi:hypothetical protein